MTPTETLVWDDEGVCDLTTADGYDIVLWVSSVGEYADGDVWFETDGITGQAQFGLTPSQARQVAARLVECADLADPPSGEVEPANAGEVTAAALVTSPAPPTNPHREP